MLCNATDTSYTDTARQDRERWTNHANTNGIQRLWNQHKVIQHLRSTTRPRNVALWNIRYLNSDKATLWDEKHRNMIGPMQASGQRWRPVHISSQNPPQFVHVVFILTEEGDHFIERQASLGVLAQSSVPSVKLSKIHNNSASYNKIIINMVSIWLNVVSKP